MFRRLILNKPQWYFYRKCSAGPLGFIGLGNMGLPLAKKLAASGNKLVCYDTKQKTPEGLEVVESPAAVARECKIIFTLLPNYNAVAQVCDGKDGILTTAQPNTLLVDMSTIGPVNALYLNNVLTEHHIEFLSAPISGRVHLNPKCSSNIFLVGGDKNTLKKAEIYLRQLGKNKEENNIYYMGPEIGDGQTARVCNLLLLACTLVGTAEIMNLGIRLGLDPKVLAQGLDNSTARCWSCSSYNPIPDVVPDTPACNDYEPGESIEVLMQALQVAQDVATKVRAPILLGALACQFYNLAMSHGYAKKDISVVYNVMRQTNIPTL